MDSVTDHSIEDDKELNKIAEWAYQEFNSGNKIGIRCQLGINRSTYLAGKLLIKLGYEPVDAIALIRRKRSPFALNNKHFEEALLAG